MCLSDHYLEYQRQLLFCFLKPSLIIIEMKPVLPLTFLLCVHENLLLLLSDSLFPSSLYLVAPLFFSFFFLNVSDHRSYSTKACQAVEIIKRPWLYETDSFFCFSTTLVLFALTPFFAPNLYVWSGITVFEVSINFYVK